MTRSITISVRSALAAVAIAVSIGAWFLLSPSQVMGQGHRAEGYVPMSSVTFRGNLTVEFALDPAAGPAGRDFTGPFQRVDEITLTDEYVVLRKAGAGGRGSLIFPRSRLVYLNIGE